MYIGTYNVIKKNLWQIPKIISKAVQESKCQSQKCVFANNSPRRQRTPTKIILKIVENIII